MITEERYFQMLLEEVEIQLGCKITSATECEKLSQELATNFSIQLTSQSIRRMYKLIKYDGGFNKHSLNCLSQYCYYQDYEDFKNKKSLNDLDRYFQFQHKDEFQNNFFQISEELCYQLIDSPQLLMNSLQQLLENPMARKYFMEHHPMRDLLCTPYILYFQEYLKHNNSHEAKLFAYGFLFHAAFLSSNDELMQLYYQKILETPIGKEVFVIPAGRKYGIMLLYADKIGDENLFKNYFEEMKKARTFYFTQSESSVCSFEYMVLEELIYTQRKAEIQYLLENQTTQKYPDQSFVPEKRKISHQQVWLILSARAYQILENHEQSKSILSEINLEFLTIGWQKYYSIIYYYTIFPYSKEQRKISKKLSTLIVETKISYWQTKMEELANPKKIQASNISTPVLY